MLSFIIAVKVNLGEFWYFIDRHRYPSEMARKTFTFPWKTSFRASNHTWYFFTREEGNQYLGIRLGFYGKIVSDVH